MKKYNVGVLGIGDISDVYIRNLKKYAIVDVAACAGRDLKKARDKAAAHGIAKAYATPVELLADPDIDIILILTPPAAHFELNRMALEAGKPVYTEKPLAATFARGEQLIALARRRGLFIGCAPDTSLGGRLQTCRELVDSGEIGEATGACAFVVSHGPEWLHASPDFFYKPGGGPLLDIGPDYVTALASLLGPAKRCSAMAKRSFATRTIESQPNKGGAIDAEVDTHISGNIEFADGAIAALIASFDVWDSELPRLEIYRTKGTILIRDIDPVDGPNLFGGVTLPRDIDNYRLKGLPRQTRLPEWKEVSNTRRFNETSHRENSRGIGLVDMAYAIRDKRPERASGAMALHGLENTEGCWRPLLKGASYI